MTKYMHISVTKERATLESQVHLNRSDLPFSEEVKKIELEIEKDLENTELWIKKGIALSKQMLFREAIEAYSIGLTFNPFHALAYRHRGHRLISIRRFHEAALDLELSSRLNPTNWDTWYHLGLAYYLLEDYIRAEKAYKRCLEITNSDDLMVAIVDWYWMTLMHLGKVDEANKLLDLVTEDTNPGENLSYKKRVLMYKGIIKPEDLIEYEGAEFPDLELATQGYGVANYYLLMGEKDKAEGLFEKILKNNSFWSSFGYLASFVAKEKEKKGK
jgi:tetratricopeptide (TPR) repeat protein